MEVIIESEIGKEIALTTLANKVSKKAKQAHKEAFPDFKVPDFSNNEIKIERIIIGELELRNIIGHYDAEKKLFTPLTIEMLIEKEKLNSNVN
jgi:hypothetical protein